MKPHRNLWPLGIFVTFGLFFTGMASVVIIAATHRENLVNNHYYEQELKFQKQIDAVARTQKSGATIDFDAGAGLVLVTLPPGAPLPQPDGLIEFYRPSAPELDHQVPLALSANGTQTLDVSKLAPGLWYVRVQWTGAGQPYYLEQKITVTGN